MMSETTNLDLDDLILAESSEARMDVEPVALENVSHAFVREHVERLNEELKVLTCRALIELDQMIAANEAAEPGDKTSLRCRVRHKEATLEIAWERQFYYQRKSPPKKGSKAYAFKKEDSDGRVRWYGLKSKYIRRGNSDRYSNRVLLAESDPDWAVDMADQMEDKFELLRKQIRLIGQIKKQLYYYDQISKRYFDLVLGNDEDPNRMKPIIVNTQSSSNDEDES